MALCLVLSSCGLTNPYEKWLKDENPDRLLPSELKALLCNVGTWVVDYDGTDVFFQFSTDWSLTSDSEIPQVATNSTFNLMSLSAKEISLTLVGAGHLSYIEKTADETYIVTSFSSSAITATGKNSGKQLSFVPGDEDVLAELAASKEALLVTVEACNAFVSAGFKTAAVHNADGDFVCRFSINPEPRTIQFDVIADGELTHTSVTVEADEDESLNFESAITLNGIEVTGLAPTSNGVAFKGGSGLKVKSNGDSRTYFLSGDYKTHAFSLRHGRGDAVEYLYDELELHDEWGDIELNEREKRPIVFCPDNDKEKYWYTFFDIIEEEKGAKVSAQYNDIIFVPKTAGYMPFGGWEDGKGGEYDNAAEILNTLPRLMNGLFHADGLALVRDFDAEGISNIWVLSPTTDFWLRTTINQD
jgi:hypothetical protein